MNDAKGRPVRQPPSALLRLKLMRNIYCHFQAKALHASWARHGRANIRLPQYMTHTHTHALNDWTNARCKLVGRNQLQVRWLVPFLISPPVERERSAKTLSSGQPKSTDTTRLQARARLRRRVKTHCSWCVNKEPLQSQSPIQGYRRRRRLGTLRQRSLDILTFETVVSKIFISSGSTVCLATVESSGLLDAACQIALESKYNQCYNG